MRLSSFRPQRKPPSFFRTVYDQTALDSCFYDLIHAPVSEQDKIEVGCLIQYFMILKNNGLMDLPIDITKHRQGEGPDFTLCDNTGLYGVEMTKVTTQDYQVWLKRRMNYRPIRDMSEFMEHRPEQRVAALAALRVMRKNFKIENYYASVPDMSACDLVLEEDGDTAMNEPVLMALVQEEMKKLRNQRFRRVSLLSGSVLYYAINTPDAKVLYAPEVRPVWLRPMRAVAAVGQPLGWH